MKKTFLYRHFDKDGKLLYVGISLNHMARLQQHKEASKWFDQIANVKVEQFATRMEAMLAETKAINEENPIYNIQKKGIPLPEPEPERVQDSRNQITYKMVSLRPLYTPQEVGSLLNLSGHSIKALIDSGDLGTVIVEPRTDKLSAKGTPFKAKTYITGWQVLDCLEYLMERGK
jgi:predicted GIY-YIG superfamily endonuclease